MNMFRPVIIPCTTRNGITHYKYRSTRSGSRKLSRGLCKHSIRENDMTIVGEVIYKWVMPRIVDDLSTDQYLMLKVIIRFLSSRSLIALYHAPTHTIHICMNVSEHRENIRNIPATLGILSFHAMLQERNIAMSNEFHSTEGEFENAVAQIMRRKHITYCGANTCNMTNLVSRLLIDRTCGKDRLGRHLAEYPSSKGSEALYDITITPPTSSQNTPESSQDY